MSHPHITQADRDAIEDRGLVENDHTPDMRKPSALRAEGFRNPHHPFDERNP